MKIEQLKWNGTGAEGASSLGAGAQLVLLFAGTSETRDPERLKAVRARYPEATVVGCSTAGEILGTQVFDDSLITTAVRFDGVRIEHASSRLAEGETSFECGARVAGSLPKERLRHVLVLSDGIHVNGSDLARGVRSGLPEGVQVTGGLSGDGGRFKETFVITADGPKQRAVSAVGFYGEGLEVGYGSLGGWDAFGPERVITRSAGNVLYELDGQPALALYKRYLGEHAKDLPGSGLLFPLSVRSPAGPHELVRTLLSIDEGAQSMTFAGDLPLGHHARLMKANFDRLVEGAQGAASASVAALRPGADGASLSRGASSLAVLISCVGRKMVLQQRTEDELEAVREVLGPEATMTGFYSYGEICPSAPGAACDLHNQTMTITTFVER